MGLGLSAESRAPKLYFTFPKAPNLIIERSSPIFMGHDQENIWQLKFESMDFYILALGIWYSDPVLTVIEQLLCFLQKIGRLS